MVLLPSPPNPLPKRGEGAPRARCTTVDTPSETELDVGRARRRPFLDDGGERVEAVGQRRRPRLQDERRLDLAHKVIAHGGNVGEPRPRRDLGRHEPLAAPGADDDVGLGGDQLVGGYDAALAVLAPGKRGKHTLAPGEVDGLADPPAAGHHPPPPPPPIAPPPTL